MDNQIDSLKAVGKFNNKMNLIDFTEQFYPGDLSDYPKEKFQIFRKDFFRWFVTLNVERQTRYIELVNQAD